MWRVDVTSQQSYDVDEAVLLEEFAEEWADAQKRGLDVEGFVRETVDIMRAYLDETPDLYRLVWSNYELDVTALAKRALSGAGGADTKAGA